MKVYFSKMEKWFLFCLFFGKLMDILWGWDIEIGLNLIDLWEITLWKMENLIFYLITWSSDEKKSFWKSLRHMWPPGLTSKKCWIWPLTASKPPKCNFFKFDFRNGLLMPSGSQKGIWLLVFIHDWLIHWFHDH